MHIDNLLFMLRAFSPLAYMFMAGFVVFAIMAAILLLQLRKQKKNLERVVTQKTEELRFSLLQLEATEVELTNNLAFRERMISIVMHDLKSPLNFVHKIAASMYESNTNISQADLHRLSFELYQTTFDINNFVNNLLQWLNSTKKNIKLSYTTEKLNDFIRNNCAVYFKIASEKKLQFNLLASDNLSITADFSLFSIVLRNLLDNAIKNTREGKIEITAHIDDRLQYIIISDTGSGIAPDKIVELESGVITKKTSESTQIGYRIVYDLMQKMKGSIHIKSTPDKGTQITLQLPAHRYIFLNEEQE
ncbi:MAG: sensor histidine kinase [Bacteroidota bacterium]|jgi:signal transduction histidine kinase